MLWEGAGAQQEEVALEHTFFLGEASLTLLSCGKASVTRLLEDELSPEPGCFLVWV